MTVKACFKVDRADEREVGGYTQVTLSAVMSDGNTEWSKYTPSGQITMAITNPSAEAFFVQGETLYLTFSKE
jgi:hypothetical protein